MNKAQDATNPQSSDGHRAMASGAAPVPSVTPSLATSAAEPFARLPANFGRYELRRLLGRGGMGAVFLAFDQQLSRLVALKMPRLEGTPPEVVQRFQREARAAAALNHPNICPVHDVGVIDGRHYLTMAYVEGDTLADVLRREGPLSADRAVAIVHDVAFAIDEAHRHGILHRDLKPSNIMIDRHGRAVVMDFGLAQRIEAKRDERLTQIGAVVGTPAYMAPEQIDGSGKLGPAVDVYSLGVILYEALTGKLPHTAPSLPKLLVKIETETPAAPRSLRPELDSRLDAICLTALARRPDQRFAAMAEFEAALSAFGAHTMSR